MGKCFQDTLVDLLAVSEHSLRYDYDWNLSLDWLVGSRLQTDLLTLDNRSGEPKIDNGSHHQLH
jgi:hypothetical protein